MRIAIILTILFALSDLGNSQTTWYVPDDFPTIQGAISDASVVHGDTVIVRSGTYVENIDFKGKAINLKSNDGAEATVIDGNQAGSVVSFVNAEGIDSVLEGFTISNGIANYGGGINCRQSSPTIKNNIITGNSADCGGGICCGNAVIKNNLITQNEALGCGGGIDCYWNGTQITNNVIVENTAGWRGGGVASDSSLVANNLIMMNFAQYYGGGIADRESTIMDNIITKNYAVQGGGGICGGASSGKSFIINNIISWNKTDPQSYGGGGIYWQNSNAVIWLLPEIINCVIYGNSSCYGGGICVSGLLCNWGPTKNLVNSILWNNEATIGPEIYNNISDPGDLKISFSNIKGGKASVYGSPEWGAGIIDADPLFVDPVNSDFHLTFPSPCKDTGDNTAVTEPFDFENDPRIAYGTVDMGADEFYTHLYVTGDQTPGCEIQGKIVGLPGTSPVRLFIGLGGVRPTALPTAYGDLWLLPPRLSIPLVPIPSNGILAIPTTIPTTPPAPYDIPMQGLVGLNSDSLTNLCVLEVR